MQALIEKLVNGTGIMAPVAAFAKQHVNIVVEEELSREPPITGKITSPLGRFPWASAGTKLDEEFKARRSKRRINDRKDQTYRNSSVEPRDKRKKHQPSSSSSSQVDSSHEDTNLQVIWLELSLSL